MTIKFCDGVMFISSDGVMEIAVVTTTKEWHSRMAHSLWTIMFLIPVHWYSRHGFRTQPRFKDSGELWVKLRKGQW